MRKLFIHLFGRIKQHRFGGIPVAHVQRGIPCGGGVLLRNVIGQADAGSKTRGRLLLPCRDFMREFTPSALCCHGGFRLFQGVGHNLPIVVAVGIVGSRQAGFIGDPDYRDVFDCGDRSGVVIFKDFAGVFVPAFAVIGVPVASDLGFPEIGAASIALACGTCGR